MRSSKLPFGLTPSDIYAFGILRNEDCIYSTKSLLDNSVRMPVGKHRAIAFWIKVKEGQGHRLAINQYKTGFWASLFGTKPIVINTANHRYTFYKPEFEVLQPASAGSVFAVFQCQYLKVEKQ